MESQDDKGAYCSNTNQVEVSGSTEVVIAFAYRGSGATTVGNYRLHYVAEHQLDARI